jgi:hypothetical protein
MAPHLRRRAAAVSRRRLQHRLRRRGRARRGWEAIGIDLNPSAVEFGERAGLDLRAVALDDGGFEPAASTRCRSSTCSST